MTKYPYKAYHVDVVNEEIKEVEITCFDDLYKYIDCRTFTTAGSLKNMDTMFVDDEGLLVAGKRTFNYSGYSHQPLFGNGLLVGGTMNGDSCSPTTDLETFKQMVSFYPQYVSEIANG